jgi:hypothetical protein
VQPELRLRRLPACAGESTEGQEKAETARSVQEPARLVRDRVV